MFSLFRFNPPTNKDERILDIILSNQGKLEEQIDDLGLKLNDIHNKSERSLQATKTELKEDISDLERHTTTLEGKLNNLSSIPDKVDNIENIVKNNSRVVKKYEEEQEMKESTLRLFQNKALEDVYRLLKWIFIFGCIVLVGFGVLKVYKLVDSITDVVQTLPAKTP